MHRIDVRTKGMLLGMGLAWIGGCAPFALAEGPHRVVLPTLSFDAASARLHFHDGSGRLRELPLLDDAHSIQLDPRPGAAWPSFLDARTPESTAPPVTDTLAMRLESPSLDSSGRWW